MTGMIPARAAKLTVALLAAIAAVAVTAGTASAGTTRTLFEAEYGTSFGTVHCVGHRQVNEAKYASKGWLTAYRDIEQCHSLTGKFTGLTGGERANAFPGLPEWDSDYNNEKATWFEYKVSRSDETFKIIAYYAG